MTATIPTWRTDPESEGAMALSHAPYWRRLIELLPEKDLGHATVLDFGCNQGGFLRLLHAVRPFRRGVGLDIATDSIARANELKGPLPIHYEVADDLEKWAGRFDIAFSYEVVYLLPDLAAHAAAIAMMLKPGGVYYAVTGCHTGNPRWPSMRERILKISNLPPQDQSLNDIGDAFAAQGLEVSGRRLAYDGFVKYRPAADDADYGTVLDYYTDIKTVFRVVRPG